MEIKTIKCDQCEVEVTKREVVRLTEIEMIIKGNEVKKGQKDFCSNKCLIDWINNLIGGK